MAQLGDINLRTTAGSCCCVGSMQMEPRSLTLYISDAVTLAMVCSCFKATV